MSNATCLMRPRSFYALRRVKDHHNVLQYSPLLKKMCVRQVVWAGQDGPGPPRAAAQIHQLRIRIVRGFHSVRFLISRGGIPKPVGNSPSVGQPLASLQVGIGRASRQSASVGLPMRNRTDLAQRVFQVRRCWQLIPPRTIIMNITMNINISEPKYKHNLNLYFICLQKSGPLCTASPRVASNSWRTAHSIL